MFCLENQIVLMRIDAGPWVGTSQVSRSLKLAESLKKFGINSCFLVPPIPRLLRRSIADRGFELTEFQTQFEGDQKFGELIEATDPGWLVSNSFDDRFRAKAENSCLRFISMDSRNGIITIDSHSDSRKRLSKDRLIGPEYHVAGGQCTRQKTIIGNAKKIVAVCTSHNSLRSIIKSISDASLTNLIVDAVTVDCEYFGYEERLKELNCNLRFHKNFDHLQPCFEFADLAIVDCWDNYWLAVNFGLPSIFLEHHSNQSDLVNHLERLGCVLCFNPELSQAKTGAVIRKTLRNRELRQKLLSNSQKLIDDNGSERIARAMVAAKFSIRPCTIDDSEILYAWRNDPEQRVVCFQQDLIPLTSHQQWLRARLDDSNSEIYVIQDPSRSPVGQFRLEFDDDRKSVRLHLSLVPSLRGFGLGTAFIERACRLVESSGCETEVYAYIKSNNSVSQAAFRKAGFESVSTTTINGQVAIRFHRLPKLRVVTQLETPHAKAA